MIGLLAGWLAGWRYSFAKAWAPLLSVTPGISTLHLAPASAALPTCPGLHLPLQPATLHLAPAPAGRKNWIRIPAILYGSFVTATMVPILAELATHTGEQAVCR